MHINISYSYTKNTLKYFFNCCKLLSFGCKIWINATQLLITSKSVNKGVLLFYFFISCLYMVLSYLFSATASYRLLPEVTLTREVRGSEASLLQSCFAPGVISLDSEGRAYVRDARYDTCSRNVFRYDEIKDAVILSRVRDHFICTYLNIHLF